jgi:hypothetical protein
VGTNYYAVYNECSCCGRFDELHVGKSFKTVRSYDTAVVNSTRDSDISEGGKSKHMVGPIKSWSDWLAFFKQTGVRVVDEYGVSVDLEDFIERWKPIDNAQEIVDDNNNRWREMFGTNLGDYLDDDGFIMCSREFS